MHYKKVAIEVEYYITPSLFNKLKKASRGPLSFASSSTQVPNEVFLFRNSLYYMVLKEFCTILEFQKYNPGDLVMLREMGDLSKKREVYIVVKDEGDLVEIRKMEKQLRLKTYEVDRDQIFKIFKPLTENSKGQEISEEAVNSNNEEKKEEKVSGERNRMKRRAAEKSEIKTHQLAIDKVIRIARNEKQRMTEEKKRAVERSEKKKGKSRSRNRNA